MLQYLTSNDVLLSDCQCVDRTIAVSYLANQVILASCCIPYVNYTVRTTVQTTLRVQANTQLEQR